MNNDFKLIAHRGYHLKSKENTLFSFVCAIKNNFYGFDTNGKLKALNIGVTEMITNFLVGNDGENYE